MQFELRPNDALPCLAWCARMHANDNVVTVWHGSRVEAGSVFVVEGAWDGLYDDGRFDRAVTFTGSGLRIEGTRVIFASPTHNLEHLYSIRTQHGLFVSNSMAFLLTRAGDALDLDYPNYYFDMLRYYRAGLSIHDKTLPTANGNKVYLYDCVNLVVDANLDAATESKHFGNAPQDYQAYENFMQQTVTQVANNAIHSSRRHRYPMVTSISRGYDSPAVSVLGVRSGCRDAVTFMQGGDSAGNLVADDGVEIGTLLGLDVATFERKDIEHFECPGPYELYTNPFNVTERQMPLMTSHLAGRLFLSGRHGEHFWNLDPIRSLPWFQEYASVSTPGANSTEMRLRIGYLHYPVPYTLGVHAPALHRISRSAPMAPWRIGGNYDRPIPRRLLEEAGIPRQLFGQVKIGGMGINPQYRKLSPKWNNDFLDFYHTQVNPVVRERLVDEQIGTKGYYEKGKMGRWHRWLHTRYGVRKLLSGNYFERRHHMWSSRYLYTFHWGFERTCERYRIVDHDPHSSRPGLQ